MLAEAALLRYFCGMATIRIRDIPEAVYEIIRRRARAAGQSIQAYIQSIQAYMKNQVERLARQPDEDELFTAIERFVGARGIEIDMEALLAGIDDGR